MNRENKFRALKDDMSDCSFVYGQLVYRIEELSGMKYPAITTDGQTFISCLPNTEGIFIGVLDKNKKEIYEKDVVKNVDEYQIKYRPNVEELRVIEFDNIAQGCEPFIEIAASGWQSAYPEDVEVIGNIIENPELLENN